MFESILYFLSKDSVCILTIFSLHVVLNIFFRDDGVAAEATIDFDAPYIDSGESVKMWIGGFLFFMTVFGIVKLIDPTQQRLAVIFTLCC